MQIESLREEFILFCKKNKFEENIDQIKIIEKISDFLKKKNFLNFFKKSNKKKCFYLFGGVGVGKTMVFDFAFNQLECKKQRTHFNEFMISFHNHRHKKKSKKVVSIDSFVKKLKKYKLIYLDEFQVTNIVDAMILGNLFKKIFDEGIKVFITSNDRPDDLYKDGLQRSQFLPFIKILKNNSIIQKLSIENDYRKLVLGKLIRTLYPLNKKTKFKMNKIFRNITKNKIKASLNIKIKGRNFKIINYYDGIARFDFKDLCDKNVGAEDYIEISNKCKFMIIENIPKFNEENSNLQNRFITLIDILYEKKIPLLLSLETYPNKIGSSLKLRKPFKRTLSRIYELTSKKIIN